MKRSLYLTTSQNSNSSGSNEQNELSLLVVTPPDALLWRSKQHVHIRVYLCPILPDGERGCSVFCAVDLRMFCDVR